MSEGFIPGRYVRVRRGAGAWHIAKDRRWRTWCGRSQPDYGWAESADRAAGRAVCASCRRAHATVYGMALPPERAAS